MEKYKSYRIVVTSLLALGALTQGVQAMSMFTTQTEMDCAGCHMQNIPKYHT